MPPITIRPVEQTDAAAIQQHAAHPQLHLTCNLPFPYPEGGAESFLTAALAAQRTSSRFVFAVLDSGQFAGIMTLNDVRSSEGSAQLDYWIAHPFWGRGIATRAADLVIAHAFHELNLHTLFSQGLARNPASGRVVEKNGFVRIGQSVYQGPCRDRFEGEILVHYQLTREGWQSRGSRHPSHTR